MLIERIRRDFRLSIVVMFGAIAILGITPFAFYRFLQGQVVLGTLDLLLIGCIGAGSVQVLRSSNPDRASLFLALCYSSGCVAVAHIAGLSGLLWAFPVLVANFMLVRGWRASLVSAITIGALVIIDTALDTPAEKAIFVATSLVVSLFAFVFASRSELQRAQLKELALHDPLTGASNRRGMQEELEVAIAASERDGQPLALFVFDLDHFKHVNDSLGHDAGDRVLVQVADIVRATTRPGDRFFRLGGEEFGLLVPGAPPASLPAIAEKLRCAVEREVRCGSRPVTISVGVTPYCTGEAPSNWQRRADAAMYRAKRTGRNRSVVDLDCEGSAPTDAPGPLDRNVTPLRERHARSG
jgi:diguanylate cyclase (GGDEF)-like protein